MEREVKSSKNLWPVKSDTVQARRHGGGGIPEPCAPKWLLVTPKRKLCPFKRGLCPKEINRLGATGVQIEAWDSQKSA